MKGFTRFGSALALFLVAQQAHATVNGSITSPVFSFNFGATPGKDQFDLSGSYVLGSGSNGIHLPSEAVVVSFDNGRFIQALPSGSFTAISGGWRYTAPSTTSGITQLKWMNNGTFLLQVRNSDFTGTSPTRFGAISITLGDDAFATTPNSLPVAKIQGSATAQVGALQTLDGSLSSDFGGGSALAYAWTIMSQPLGSGISLSSGTNATTSFTPTHNGAYVFKLVNSDGLAAGVPALLTVTASGASLPPPPAPAPSNGVATLSTNSPSYLVGDVATLTLNEDAQPGNGTSRWFFNATLNDAPITLTPVPSSTQNSYVTPVLAAAGAQTFKADVYLENTNLAKALAAQITALDTDITAINSALLYETDPAVIADLQARKASDLDQITIANDQLWQNRTKVGETAVLTFQVHE